MNSVYSYQNHRDYLRDFVKWKKTTNRAYSYRLMAKKLRINPATLVRIINGQRNLSNDMLQNLLELLALESDEKRYFEALVKFNQSKRIAEQEMHYGILMLMRRTHFKRLQPSQHEFYENWYHSVVREIIDIIPVKEGSSELASSMLPKIKKSDFSKSLDLLLRLGLVRRNASGRYEQTNKLITTGDRWTSIAVRNFQKAMITLALNSLDSLAKEERDVSTVTVSLDQESLAAAKKVIENARQEIMETAASCTGANRVYQANFQLFPLTRNFQTILREV